MLETSAPAPSHGDFGTNRRVVNLIACSRRSVALHIARVHADAVHLRQQGRQDPLLHRPARRTAVVRSSTANHRVDLVNEQQRRCAGSRLPEELRTTKPTDMASNVQAID
jgi:hypothetical protein